MKDGLENFGKFFLNAVIFGAGLLLHAAALWAIYRAYQPVALWYWQAMPVRGVDLLNATTYVAYLSRHTSWFVNGWKYIWFAGWPLVDDYPALHFYLALPFLKWFTAIKALQFWMLVSTFLNFAFTYLLFFRLAKSRAISLLLAILVVYSVNVYGALIWGGSIPYYGSQFFLPLTLYFLTRFFDSGNQRWFAGAALALGISQYGHPQVAISYGIVISALSLFLAPYAKETKWIKKLSICVLFVVLVFLIGLPLTHTYLGNILKIPDQFLAGLRGEIPVSYQATAGPAATQEIEEFYRTRIYHFYTDTHPWLTFAAGLSILLFVSFYLVSTFVRVMINRKKKTNAVYKLLWVTLLVAYVVFYLYLYSIGIDLYHGGWFRVFWPVPMILGMVAAAAFGEALELIAVLHKNHLSQLVGLIIDAVALGIVISIAGIFYLKDFENSLYLKSVASGGFPGKAITVVGKEEQENFAKNAVPVWLPTDTHDFRLYSSDQTYNMWFNTYYEMPLARGYIDPPVNKWGIFLMDILLDRNVAQEKFAYPEEVAINATKFILDWNAIKYLAGENYGPGAYVSNNFSSYIYSTEFSQKEEVWQTRGGRLPVPGDIRGDVVSDAVTNSVKYLKLRDELVTPILSLTDAPAALFIGDAKYWEVFIRTLAQMGVTSQELIPVRGPKFLDQVKAADLAQFKALVLYGYDYRKHDEVWGLLDEYVRKGGLLFVDTGAEAKESASIDLPAGFPKELPGLFPVSQTTRNSLGKFWLVNANEAYKDIDFEKFSLLIYDDQPWNVSFAETSAVEDHATTVLALANKAVVVDWDYGSGRVIWSGLNLSAHIERNRNPEEGRFFKKLLGNLLGKVKVSRKGELVYQTDFVSSEKRTVKGKGASGVLFKEAAFPGWTAKLVADGKRQNLKIWPAGIGDPGMMWMAIPEAFQDKSAEVQLLFVGSVANWILCLVALTIMVVLADSFIFNGKVFGAMINKIWSFSKKIIGRWWEHEEI